MDVNHLVPEECAFSASNPRHIDLIANAVGR
jgi:hypothetical protein